MRRSPDQQDPPPGNVGPASYPDYPFQNHSLAIKGLHLHYLEEGATDAHGSLRRADPVVMLHGNPTWSFYFRKLVLALRDKYHCIVPDHIGMGLSDKPGDDAYEFTLSRRVDDVEALLDHLGLQENLTLVLHDWGGMIGMALAARHPGRIKRLVIMNTSAFGLPAGQPLPWQLKLARTRIGRFLCRRLNAFSLGAVYTCARKPLPPEVRAAYLAPYDTPAHRVAVHRFVKDIPIEPGDPSHGLVEEVEASLAKFRDTPMLICWGMKDFVFTPAFLQQWIAHFPRAEVHRFEDAGHFVLEDASDRVIADVQRFLHDHPL